MFASRATENHAPAFSRRNVKDATVTQALFRGLAVLTLFLIPIVASAQEAEEAPPAEPEPADIQRVIETLEDPAARAELVRELRVLLEAERAGVEEEDGLPTGGELVDAVGHAVTGLWGTITSIDPMQLLTSIGLSVLIVVGALIVRSLILRLLRRLYERLITGGDTPAEEIIEMAEADTASDGAAVEEAAQLPPSIPRLINLIIAVLIVALIAESWGAGIAALLQTSLGARIVEAGLAVGLILVVTLVAWHVAGFVVARLLTLASSHRDQERTLRRVTTLVPLLRSVLQAVIGVLAGLLILSELGVDIAPLLAGAGILGLAVGFGAQTLVKDLLTGVTILMEDGATVGDVIEVAGHSGIVEEMRVRLIRLRDLSGAVHFIPYSEVTSIINYTKDFSFALFEIGVAYREDTDEVCGVLNEVTEGMRHDRVHGPDMLEDLEILGVERFGDSAVVIKVRIKTRPGRQWAIAREFNRRMKHVFDERGIEIPFPHTTVYFGKPKDGEAPPARLAIVDAPQAARNVAAAQNLD